MNVKRLTARLAAAVLAISGFTFGIMAEGRLGVPKDKGVWFQEPANEQARRIADFNLELVYIITAITVLVFLLMFYVMWRFRAKANPVPSKVSHNTLIEIIWTGVPIMILVFIGVTSLPLLYYQDQVPETEFAINVTGNQWYWTYQYPDHGGIEFASNVVEKDVFADAVLKAKAEAELSDFLGFPATLNARLLDTNNRVVVPIGTRIKVHLTASDVIHSWAMPSLGMKLDAIPGRLNELWFEVEQVGTYYGQCSELCGKNHAYMPIAIEAVSKEDFAKWVEHAKAKYADASVSALGR